MLKPGIWLAGGAVASQSEAMSHFRKYTLINADFNMVLSCWFTSLDEEKHLDLITGDWDGHVDVCYEYDLFKLGAWPWDNERWL